MKRSFAPHLLAAIVVVTAGCSSTDPGNNPGPAADLSSCTATNTMPVTLAVGDYQIVDALHQASCLSLPGSGDAAEYVMIPYSGYGVSTNDGTSASYALQSALKASASGRTSSLVADLGAPLSSYAGNTAPTTPASFEHTLRMAERRLAASGGVQIGAAIVQRAIPPAVGDRDSFNVCATSDCSSFNKIGATVKYAGNPGVIYLDDHQLAGADAFTGEDIQQFGLLFDNYLYATDTTAFGRESDINGDGHISILMTPAVNQLTTDCTQGRIIGYTFSNDLIPFARGSNAREMFYTVTTSPATAKCKAVTHTGAINVLPATLIHELQHMISFNQHVLLRGSFDQDVWMNEGLSHFAEELGWRTVPASECTTAVGGDCFSEFAGGDVGNAYAYLNDTESNYLVAPESGDGTLPERGAAWLFIRWIADHFSADSVLGTQFTRAMEQTTGVGAKRVSEITGVDFPTLVGEWQLANWTGDLPGFPQTSLLNYRSWNFRHTFANNFPSVFAKIFPLTPDSTTGGYGHAGTLRAGSGRTVRYKVAAGSPGVTVRLAGSAAGGALSTLIMPYIAIVRVQ